MSLVQGLPYFKVPFIMPLGTNTGQYAPAQPVVTLDEGDYLVLFNIAIVGSTNQSSITITNPFVFSNAQGFGVGNIVVNATKMSAAVIDSSASFPATPCVLYRNLSNTLSVSQSTPIYVSFDNTITGGTTQSSSFAAQDALYNFIHFIKLSP